MKQNVLYLLVDLCLFWFFHLQCRKHKDLYLWMVKSPGGPSVKFLVNAGNVYSLSNFSFINVRQELIDLESVMVLISLYLVLF